MHRTILEDHKLIHKKIKHRTERELGRLRHLLPNLGPIWGKQRPNP